jgi:glycosyltransferase involved in cell wall biosynthesis
MAKISVILPVFNETDSYLRAALESLCNQTMTDWECILIVESTDYRNIITINKYIQADRRFIMYRPPVRLGLSSSLNEGVGLAKTELVARMDSDDIMLPSRLEKQLAFLEANPDIDILGSAIRLINEHDQLLNVRSYPNAGIKLRLYFIFRCGISHPTVVFKKSKFMSIGGYKNGQKYAEDLDLWLRMIKSGFQIYNLSEILLYYRNGARRPLRHWLEMLKVRVRNIL